jgi:hypothetical protein
VSSCISPVGRRAAAMLPAGLRRGSRTCWSCCARPSQRSSDRPILQRNRHFLPIGEGPLQGDDGLQRLRIDTGSKSRDRCLLSLHLDCQVIGAQRE